MHLEKLEIQGFKSFAQKTVLHFPLVDTKTKGITAVVGPNGSGKSNIADAIRWVLGEQSAKQLRGKKSEDIIFFGSQTKSRLGYAEVVLTFNNEDGSFPLDYPEVAITRRLYRDGESQYLVNNTPSKLSDIILLLAQAHVGQKSYSVIGQGMIDTIINATPADRKDFFYEAAGVKAYQLKKDASLSKLRQTENNVTQVTLQLAELEPKLKYLKRQMARLAQREEYETQYATIAREYYNHNWNALSNRLNTLTGQKQGIQERIDEVTSKLSALQQTFNNLESSTQDNQRRSQEWELSRGLNDLYRQQREISSHIALIEGRLELAMEQKGQAHIAWISRRLEELTTLISDINSQKEALSQQKNQLQTSIDQATPAIEHLLASRKEKEAALSPLNIERVVADTITDLEAISQSKHQLQAESESLDQLRTFVQTLYEKIEQMRSRFTSLEQTPTRNADIRKELEQIQRDYDTARTELERSRIQAQVLIERIDGLGQQETSALREQEKLQGELIYYNSQDKQERDAALYAEKDKATANLADINQRINTAEQELATLRQREQSSRSEIFSIQKDIQSVQETLRTHEHALSSNQVEIARYSAHRDDLLEKLCEDLAVDPAVRIQLRQSIETVSSVLGFVSEYSLQDPSGHERQMYQLKGKLAQIGTIDQEEVSEYEETKEKVEFMQTQIDDLAKAKTSLESAISELDEIIRTQFDASMKHINKSFSEYFQEVFRGGEARLILHRESPTPVEGEEDIPEEYTDEIAGVEIEATPPGKKLKSISFLSGGEKALTSIALICAIMANNPSPFVVLDEVDAALDESNAHRFSYILTQLSHKTQFIVITHNRVTMHIAQRLYGVTMGGQGVSTVVSLDMSGVTDILTKR